MEDFEHDDQRGYVLRARMQLTVATKKVAELTARIRELKRQREAIEDAATTVAAQVERAEAAERDARAVHHSIVSAVMGLEWHTERESEDPLDDESKVAIVDPIEVFAERVNRLTGRDGARSLEQDFSELTEISDEPDS